MKREAVFALAALLLAAPVLPAQDAESRIQAAQARAAQAGVPRSLLESRVAEGRAKGIPADRIAAVVERRAASLLSAREAMGRATSRLSPADLNAGADAVEAGIEAGALRTVIEQARAEDRPVAIAVLTYLHSERGLPVGEALKRVSDAMQKGPDALRTLPAQAAAEARGRGQGKGRGAGAPGGAAQAGRGKGPPQAVPAPGQKPGGGKPDGVGKGRGAGQGQGKGKGKPGGGI